jgi:chromosome segregation ATPase
MPRKLVVENLQNVTIDGVNAGSFADVFANYPKADAPELLRALVAWYDRRETDRTSELQNRENVFSTELQKRSEMLADELQKHDDTHVAELQQREDVHTTVLQKRDDEIAALRASLETVTAERDALGTTRAAQAVMIERQRADLKKQINEAQAALEKLGE